MGREESKNMVDTKVEKSNSKVNVGDDKQKKLRRKKEVGGIMWKFSIFVRTINVVDE